jgi:hypothetical protein
MLARLLLPSFAEAFFARFVIVGGVIGERSAAALPAIGGFGLRVAVLSYAE